MLLLLMMMLMVLLWWRLLLLLLLLPRNLPLQPLDDRVRDLDDPRGLVIDNCHLPGALVSSHPDLCH